VLAVAARGPSRPSAVYVDTVVLRALPAAVAVASLLLGPVWHHLDPLAALRRWAGAPGDDAAAGTAPRRPATAAFAVGAALWICADLRWRPGGLAVLVAVLAYAAAHLAASSRAGPRWLEDAAVLRRTSATLGLLAPRRPGPTSRLLALDGRDRDVAVVTAAALLAWALAELVVETGWWRQVELTGSPGLVWPAVLLACGAAAAGVVGALGRRFADVAVPLAGGWAAAQHLGPLVGHARGVLAWLSDPFAVGADLFGTAALAGSAAVLPAAVLVGAQLGALLVLHAVAARLVAARAAQLVAGRPQAAHLARLVALRPQATVLASLAAAAALQLGAPG
jgi:hypothetical protein